MMARHKYEPEYYNPDMLVLAIQLKGLSVFEFGEVSTFTAGQISKFAGGLETPTEAEVNTLSKELDFPPAHFSRDGRMYGDWLPFCNHRSDYG